MGKNVTWMPSFQLYEKMTALMPIFCQKNVNSLKNTALMPIFYQKTFSQKHDDPMSFFSLKKETCSHAHILSKNLYSLKTWRYHVFSLEFFIKNRNTVMPKSGQKNVNSVKTILSYGPQKSKWCPFFPILNEKATLFMPIFCWKNVHPLKNTMHLYPYFVKSTSIYSKSWCSHVIGSIIS